MWVLLLAADELTVACLLQVLLLPCTSTPLLSVDQHRAAWL